MDIDTILSSDKFINDDEKSRFINLLFSVQRDLSEITLEKYGRLNPFSEDITDWKKRGEFLFGQGKNISVYSTCSVSGNVEVGENTWIGPYTALDGNGGLKIGKNCSISAGVNIVTHDSVKWALSGGKLSYEYQSIEVGDNCFIGTGAFISKGVIIGNHCLIGAGAVVTRDLPPYSIALGVPARIVGEVVVKENSIEFKYF
jgi:acetyltransferase-like isoleucine patch superfamily enzyme